MAGVYGNENLAYAPSGQWVTVGGTPDLSAAIPSDSQAITLYSTTDTWWNFTERGKDTPAAAAIGAEKTQGTSKFLPAGIMVDVPVPESTDLSAIKVACLQDSAAGVLHIWHRNDTN